MFVAGIPVPADSLLELARLVDGPELADKLENAYGRDVKILALDLPERATILAALEDPPAGLAELRAVLLRVHVWRHAKASRATPASLCRRYQTGAGAHR